MFFVPGVVYGRIAKHMSCGNEIEGCTEQPRVKTGVCCSGHEFYHPFFKAIEVVAMCLSFLLTNFSKDCLLITFFFFFGVC